MCSGKAALILAQMLNCIRNYCMGSVLNTAAEMTADAIKREAYHELYDLDKDGKLDTEELKAALANTENHSSFLSIFKKLRNLNVYPMIWAYAVELRDTKFPGFDEVDSVLWALAPECIVRFVKNLPENNTSTLSEDVPSLPELRRRNSSPSA